MILSILGFILEPEGSILGPFRAPGGPWGLPGETLGPKRRPREKTASKRDFLPPPLAPILRHFQKKCALGVCLLLSCFRDRFLRGFGVYFGAISGDFRVKSNYLTYVLVLSCQARSQTEKVCFDCAGVVGLHVRAFSGTGAFMFVCGIFLLCGRKVLSKRLVFDFGSIWEAF